MGGARGGERSDPVERWGAVIPDPPLLRQLGHRIQLILDHATEVLLAALRLHKAFALGSARKLMPSVGVAIDVIQGASRHEVFPGGRARCLAVPLHARAVVSTTFASYPRLFRHLGQEDLGWLFIDEAAQ